MSEKLSDCAILPDISKPRWSQDTFQGRMNHFFATTNMLNLFVRNANLEKARKTVLDYKKGQYDPNMTLDELWKAKTLYDSAYHPDTGEKMFILGRMSAQVPCNMIITGGMLTFYQKFHHVVFFHWINQSFNAIVNYTNRSGNHPTTQSTMVASYFAATTGALASALSFNYLLKKWKNAPPLLARFVPFAAIACANAINIPMMRNKEFINGIPVETSSGKQLGLSTEAPKYAIPQVVLSRVGMAVPHMVLGPIVFDRLTRMKWYKPKMAASLQTLICGVMLAFSTPICCALFPQKSTISVDKLEKPLRDKINSLTNPPKYVIYNKGL